MAEPKVEYNFLGKSGLRVSNLCLGTMTFGLDPKMPYQLPTQSDEAKSHELMDKFAELGGNFLDTANTYMFGISESIIGTWLSKKDRDRFVIATKVRFPMDHTNPNSVGLSRRFIVESFEKSLERLKTPYVDLYQSHGWDPATPLDETLRTFDDLVRCGKVRYYGASNLCGWQLQKVVDRIEAMGLRSKCVSLQQQYNLLARHSELEEFMVCRGEGIGVLPYSPLRGGLLTGKFKRDAKPEEGGSRIGYIHQREALALDSAPAWSKYRDDEEYWKLMDELKKIADNHGKTMAQVAIRWLLQKDVVPSVIIGATSIAQLENNMGAASGWELSADEMAHLDAITPRYSGYPYNVMWGINPVFQPAIRENKFIPSVVERIITG